MRTALHIFLLTALAVTGCRKDKDPALLGKPEPPVIQPTVNNDPGEAYAASVDPLSENPTEPQPAGAPRVPEAPPAFIEPDFQASPEEGDRPDWPAPEPQRNTPSPAAAAPNTALAARPRGEATLSAAVYGEEESPAEQERSPVGLTALDRTNMDKVRAEDRPLSSQIDPSARPAASPNPPTPRRPRLAPLPGLEAAPEPAEESPPSRPKPKPVPAVAAPTIGPRPADPAGKETANLRAGLEHAAIDPATAAPVPPEPTVAEESPLKTKSTTAASPAAGPAAETGGDVVYGREVVVAGTTLQVNDRHVSVDDILAALHSELVKIPENIPEERFRQIAERTIAQEMLAEVKRILVAIEAEKLLEEHVMAEVDREMAETRRDLIAQAGSEEHFKQKCLREGTTAEAVLRDHKRHLLIQTYMRQKFYPAIVITRRMLWDYYRRHPEKFRQDKQVQTQQMAAPFSAFLSAGARTTDAERAAARQAAYEHITQARTRIEAGEPFDQVVEEMSKGPRASKGGVWPMYPKGNLAEESVEAAAFELEEGQASDVIETERGFYLVKARQVQPGKVTSFEQAQGDILDILRKEQFQEMQSEYMNKLYERSTVFQPEGFIQLAVDKAVRYYRRGEPPPVPADSRYDYLGNRQRREEDRKRAPTMGMPID